MEIASSIAWKRCHETAEAEYLLLLDLNARHAALQLPSKLLDYAALRKGRSSPIRLGIRPSTHSS